MTDTGPESLSVVPPQSDPALVHARDFRLIPHPAARAEGASQQHSDVAALAAQSRGAVTHTRPPIADNAALPGGTPSGGNSAGREHRAMAPAMAPAAVASDSQPAHSRTSTPSELAAAAAVDSTYLASLLGRQQPALSRSDSLGTNSTNGADPVFTPPANGGRLSPGAGSAHGSSQESHLLQLSQIAAAQEKMPEDDPANRGSGPPRKRMADGMVKQQHVHDISNVSPGGQMAGHSRNTSTVSAASTSGSRIGELSAELKARLSYAMVKVNHGWQSHSIDQVETLASQATSPASTASTIHLRNDSSASPQLSAASHRGSNDTTPAVGGPYAQHPARLGDFPRRESPQSRSRGSSTSPVKTPSHGLAPPAPIQPSQQAGNPRREPNPRHVPPFLSDSNPHHNTSPRAELHTSPYLAPGRQHRAAVGEAVLASPHTTTVREQDAIESLLFMSSPGNSANLKHAFPSSSSQPLPSSHAPPPSQQRTALPTSQPRKSLPSGRPPQHARAQSLSQSQPQPRRVVTFDKSPSVMDIDDPPPFAGGSPASRGTPRRRINGGYGSEGLHAPHASLPPAPPPPPQAPSVSALVPRLKHMPVSAGLTVLSKPRRPLADEEIDRMLDRAASAASDEGDSDSDGEIPIPVPRARRDGAGVVGA